MPSKISELITACEKLASGKVLERKKAAERLKCLLDVPEVLKHLDKGTHSLQNDGFGFSWISVFEAAADALEKELKSQRPSNSSITAGVKKPEMYGTIKCVLVQSHGRTTSEGKAVLSPEVVFDHMWIILSDYSHILASEYAYLLVNYFLTDSLWRHWEKPNLALLSKMLSKFIKGIAQSSQGFTTGPIPHVIKKLSTFLTARIDLKPMKFLSLFKEFFLQAKESNSQTLENMLDAVNIICERSAANCHMRLSSFGADLAMNMLQLWQNNAKQRLKMEIIRFFSLQVVLHGDDSDISWQTVLWKLYEVMCQEIGNTKPSHRLTGDNLNPVLTEEFFNLTGQVCLKLLSDGDKLMEVSQMASQSSFSGRPLKKRRVQSGWECIKSEMVNAKDFRTQIAWIRVIKAMVELSDDSSLSDEQLADVLQVMYQVLAENKRSVVFVEVNKCLCVLSTQLRLLAEEHDVTWRKILAVSISLVERRQVEFYKLITSMLKLGKRLEQTQYVRLMKSSTAAPHSAEGLHWLQCYLSMFELGLCPILSATERELDLEHASLVKHTQGQHLWQHTWVANQLLPGLEDDNGLYKVVAASQTVPANLFGQVMASLVCRDPIQPPTPVTQHEETVIRQIKELYDSMTFTPVSRSLSAVTSSQVTLLQPGAEQVAAALARKLTALSDLLDQNENTSSYIEDGFWVMEMCLSFLNICSVQEIIRCVMPALQGLWRGSVQYISQQLRQKSTSSMLPNLRSILSQHYTILSTHCSDDTRKLVLALISHIHVSMQETTTLSQGSSWSRSASNSSSIDDEFSTPTASTGFLQQLDNNFPSTSSTLSKGSSHHEMLTSMKLLVFITSELGDCRPDILDLVTKLCSDRSTNYANIAIVTMEMIIGHWKDANLETFLNMLFHTRALIEMYYTDPELGKSCLQLINKLIPQVSLSTSLSAQEREDLGSKLFMIVNGLVLQLYEKTDEEDGSYTLFPLFGVEYRLTVIECLTQLIKADRTENWRREAGRHAAISLDPTEYVIKTLRDRDYRVRRRAVQAIRVILQHPDGKPLENLRQEQEKVFDRIYKNIHSILNIDSNASDLERSDEEQTCTATLLSLFQTIIIHSTVCRKKAVCALFLCLDESNQHISSSLIRKVLEGAVLQTPYNSVAELCESSLGYVAKEWIALNFKLSQFPIDLFNESDLQNFYKKNLKVFASLAIGSEAVWAELVQLSGLAEQDILSEQLPSILLNILPALANSADNYRQSKMLFEKCTNILAAGGVQMLGLLKDKLAEILAALYSAVWDSSKEYPSEPEPCPPHYSSSEVSATNTYLLKMFHKKGVTGTSLLAILSAIPSSVSRLHFKLAHWLASGRHVHDIRQRSDAYLRFVADVLPELGSTLQDHQPLLIETIISVNLNTLSRLTNQLQISSCQDHNPAIVSIICFHIKACHTLVDHMVSLNYEVLSSVVPRLTYSLISLSNSSETDISNAAHKLLSSIWTGHADKFEGFLEVMEPLPVSTMRQHIPHYSWSASFDKLVQMYAEASHDLSHDRTLLLKAINKQLVAMDSESRKLLVSGPLLSQFVSILVQSVKHCSANERSESLKCLGRLGSSFVTNSLSGSHVQPSLVDQKLSNLTREYGDEADQRDFIILSHVIHYLLHDREEVMSVCDDLLAKLFCSKAGESVMQSLLRVGGKTQHLVVSYQVGAKFKVPLAQSTDNLLLLDNWTSYQTSTYKEWVVLVTRHATSACKTDILRLMAPLCAVKEQFCELLLPLLIHDILLKGDNSLRVKLSSIFTSVLTDAMSATERSSICQSVVVMMLRIVQFLRTKQNSLYYTERVKVHTAWRNNFWLDVNYSLLAKAALFVKNYAMAALYAELRIYQSREASSPPLPPFNAQSVMIEVYGALDDIDILCGWGVSKLEDVKSRLTHYSQENNWSRELRVKELMLSGDMDNPLSVGLETLQSCDLPHLLDSFLQNIQTVDSISEETREMRYQQAWSSMQWDKLPTVTRLSPHVGFNECMYMATKSLVTSTSHSTTSLIEHMKKICETSLVDSRRVLNGQHLISALADLELVQTLEDVVAVRGGSDENRGLAVIGWKKLDNCQYSLCDSKTGQSSLRTQELKQILRSLAGSGSEGGCETLHRYLVDSTVSLSLKAKQCNMPSTSEMVLTRFKRLYPDLWCVECDLESGLVYWAFGEKDRAMYVMKRCLDDLQTLSQKREDNSSLCFYSRALRIYGDFLTSTKLEGPDVITDNYLLPAVKMAERSRLANELEEAYHAVAEFADNEYERLRTYMTSSEFESKLSIHRVQQEQMDELKTIESSKYRRNLRSNMEMNEKEINATREAFVTNMQRALLNHIATMKNGSKYDLLSIFRVVAIWFDNEKREDIRKLIKEKLPGDLPSHKFLPLMCQLTARLSEDSSDLQTSLSQLILVAGKEHPHHVLPILFALKCAATDTSSKHVQKEVKSRAMVAKNLLKEIGQRNAQLIKEYNMLVESLISLANNKDIKTKLQPSNCKLVSLLALKQTHVLTHSLKPRASCDYSDVPHVYKYDSQCSIASGLSKPKIIKCVGSDGKIYKQLCKGKDDTRQDAVMQQVFSLVNELLHSNQSSSSLTLRTYKVIPLSQRSGLLEWCEGTIPLGAWLGSTDDTYRKGALCRYQTNGTPPQKARQELSVLQDKYVSGSYSRDSFVKAYNNLCRKIPPIFRHYFLERFTEPERWLSARRKYSQSVALTSMIGYVLGIGDRHTNNILIDENSGELIHIDFGVAFEQGKALPKPEIVPFRLTRNLVDGFGPTGVNGAFRRCCEKTLKVLRGSGRIINTILQVLIDDPILEWTLSAEQLERMQTDLRTPLPSGVDSFIHPSLASQSVILGTQANRSASTAAREETANSNAIADTNKHQQAANALLLVRNKLRGLEQNSYLSVSGQVNYLIQQAVDPANLAVMYIGWQPYL